MANLFRALMPLLHRKCRVHGDIDFCLQPMAQPSDPHSRGVTNPRDGSDRLLYFINHLWFYPIKQAGENSLPRFPDNGEDCSCDERD